MYYYTKPKTKQLADKLIIARFLSFLYISYKVSHVYFKKIYLKYLLGEKNDRYRWNNI